MPLVMGNVAMSRRYTRILCGVGVRGTYWGHPWYPRILSIKGLMGRGEGDILGTSLVSQDTKY